MHRTLHALATEQHPTVDAAAATEEWPLRAFRRRAARRALRRAGQLTTHDDLPHLARLARLATAHHEVSPDDRDAVAAAHATLPAPPTRKWPVQTFVLVAASLAVALAVVGYRTATRPFDARASGTGKALGNRLGTYVASVANGARPEPTTAMQQVFPGGSLSADLTPGMTAVFAAQLAAADDPQRMPELFARTRDVDRAFAASGQPWYLDARFYRAPLLYAFYLEREDVGRAPGFEAERIVYLWRLDRLNVSKAVLGYTHREADAALVLYDQIEELLIRDVLPALAEGEKIDLVDEASRDPQQAWQADIEVRAARLVRESFAGGGEHEQLVALGTLLARRRAIVRSWQADLRAEGRTLNAPTRLVPEADYDGDLQHLVPAASRYEWNDVHDALESKRSLETFEALRDRFAQDVARHELQHRFDGQLTKGCVLGAPCEALLVPGAVRARVGPAEGFVELGTLTARVTDETSAYLAALARPDGMPKMTLLGLLPTVLDRDAWGDAYCNTTLVLLDVLSAELGFADDGMPLVVRGNVQRAAVSSLVALLFAKSDAELRRASAGAWARLFGRELPAAEITRVHQAREWRH